MAKRNSGFGSIESVCCFLCQTEDSDAFRRRPGLLNIIWNGILCYNRFILKYNKMETFFSFS